MIRFLLTFVLLYGGMHAYAYIRVRSSFNLRSPYANLLAFWMLLQTIAPVAVRVLERLELATAAQWLAWPAYIWMGTVFIFSSFLLVADMLSLTCRLLSRFYPNVPIQSLATGVTCRVVLLSALVASGYSLYEARNVQVESVTIRTSKLPSSSPGVRIVQISDLHIGLLFHENRLNSVLEKVRQAHPDILVSTGDLIDGRLSLEHLDERFSRMATTIASVPTPGGKFACLGNHEYYAGIEQAESYLAAAGFTLLTNRTASLSSGIDISGIDDPARKRMKLPDTVPTEHHVLQEVPRNRFHIVLKHRPEIPESSDGRFDLQLSGHVHKGQILPFYPLVLLEYPIRCGTSPTPGGSKIHVSRGSGTWGPPMRLWAPPEVTVIDIIPLGGKPRI